MDYRCSKCNNVLSNPIENSANYCYDKKEDKTYLKCSKCINKKDMIIWGIDK